MAIGDIIVGIDIGTSKVTAVVGEINSFNQVEIIKSSDCKCFGIRKGKIINENEISLSISNVISQIEDSESIKINSAYVNILGKYVTIVQNSIVKEVKDKYAGISSKDVTSAIMQVKDIDIPEDKVLIDIITNQFVLDNGKVVDDPIGTLSSSFTLEAQIMLADK
ncbi:MAG: hypothetical protein LBL91_04205, partial [Lachnospiraceae bacterium]|nr:hypothetical protein [Lachnospiraceae bacterium]